MQSAELSGVTGKRGVWPGFEIRQAAMARPRSPSVRRVSPVSLAIGGTAIVAALLFIASDLLRSIEEMRVLAAVSNIDASGIWIGVEQRGAVALVLAVLAAALAYRRREIPAAPQFPELFRLSELIETVPVGLALWSDKAELVACNERFARRLSHAEAPAAAATYHDAIGLLLGGGRMQPVLETPGNRIIELHRPDGACLMVDERPLASGGFITLVTDISERKRTDLLLSSVQEEQRELARRYHHEKLKAEAASRAKTSFLAHLSHDIRTPLNHIIGFSDMLKHETWGPLGDARYLDYVETIKSSGEKLLASFASILELVQFESGGRPLDVTVVDVDEVTRAVIRRFSAQAGRAGLTLALAAPCHAHVLADRYCLERMLGNLMDNAIRFTPIGGRVGLAARASADGIVLEVADSGIGMSEAQVRRLSQPFVFGEDEAFAHDHDGAGLGVAIARSIAELSGGRLAISSRPSLGTTVAVSLPLPLPEALPKLAA